MTTGGTVKVGLHARTQEISGDLELLDHLGQDGFAWIRDGAGFVTSGVAARACVEGVADLLATIDVDGSDGPPGRWPIAVGALPFDDAAAGELVVPARVVWRSADGDGWITEIGPAETDPDDRVRALPSPGRFSVRPGLERDAWTGSVGAVLDAIEEGRVRKVVLARKVLAEADQPFDRTAVIARLAHSHPECFTFAAGGLVGASPELLLRRTGRQVESCPMAGTSAPTDADQLHGSIKNRAEHHSVVTAVAEALGPVCEQLAVPDAPEVRSFPTVAHLVSCLTGVLRPPAPSALELACRLHPTPAVGGAPTDAARNLIATLERMRRGSYAGPVGWVDGNGDGEWAVALRCAEIQGRKATLFAGAGIVEGSDPDEEWVETQRKLEPMLAALIRP